jgi:hypothetical protein
MLNNAGFSQIDIDVVSRENQPPNFQTLLATATK